MVEFPPDKNGWRARAAAVEAAHRSCNAAFAQVTDRRNEDAPATRLWLQAVERFRASLAAFYSPQFEDMCRSLQAGDPRQLDSAIDYLEADPHCFRSGSAREALITSVNRLPRSDRHNERLRAVVLSIVDRRDGRDFRSFCRLARRLGSPQLRLDLERRLASDSPAIRRRAGWVLAAMDQRA